MPAFPQFYASAAMGIGQITTLSAQRDGVPTASATLITAGVNGTRVDQVTVLNSTTDGTTPGGVGVARLWIVLDSGPTWRLFDEVVLPATQPTNAAAGARAVLPYTNLVLPSGYSLRCSVDSSSATGMSYNFVALGGHY